VDEDGPVRVLLVQDDVELAGAIARLLRQSGFEVVVTPSCSTTLALTCCFEVGVFDIELPDGDGIQLASELMDAELVQRAVFFSAAEQRPRLARAAQVAPVVPRSHGIDALLAVVQGALGRRAPTSSVIVPSSANPASSLPQKKRLRSAG
jgi:DNA-binding response OmpR family regulator